MTAWLTQNMIWASVLMLVVLAIRLPVARWLGAGAAYALWLAPGLRLVMPPLPERAADLRPTTAIIVNLNAGDPAAATAGMDWTGILFALWATGAMTLLIWQWRAYRAFLTRLSLTSRSIGAHDGLPLIESEAVEGPVALGLLDRRIVVPADFEQRYGPAERALALDHEAVHHRRGDIWWNHLALGLLALNWFNPIAWLAFRAFRADQELACDAAVTAARSPESRCDYAEALLKSVSPAGLVTAAPLNRVDQLKRRLKMLKTHRRSALRSLGGIAAVTILVAGGALLGSAGVAHPHPESGKQEHRERIIIMDRHRDGAQSGHAGHGEHREHGVVIRRGPNGEMVEPSCGEGERTDLEEGTDGQRTRIMLCSRGNATPAQRAEHLQRARDRLAQNDELSAETRARITAQLDREIARLRGQ
ncbi:M56 family metallopeptidase [Sphingosinicella sp.]|uniref:M56 family metallopeptidase n=1 Tax=Sphingosinicella sp. TaxID=1917971 RepID=UPI004037931B